jgi:hypothetical protein
LLKPNVFCWFCYAEADSTRGGWFEKSQFLTALLTNMMSSSPGTVFLVSCMKLVN